MHAQKEYTDQLLSKYLLRKDRGRFISRGLSPPFTNFRGAPAPPAPLVPTPVHMKYCKQHSTSHLEIDHLSICKQLIECSMPCAACIENNFVLSLSDKSCLCSVHFYIEDNTARTTCRVSMHQSCCRNAKTIDANTYDAYIHTVYIHTYLHTYIQCTYTRT